MQVSKCSRVTDSSAHPVHSITNSKTRLEMALMGMRITSLPVFANLHYNSGVGTFLHRIEKQETGLTAFARQFAGGSDDDDDDEKQERRLYTGGSASTSEQLHERKQEERGGGIKPEGGGGPRTSPTRKIRPASYYYVNEEYAEKENCVSVNLCCRGCKTPILVMLDMHQRFVPCVFSLTSHAWQVCSVM